MKKRLPAILIIAFLFSIISSTNAQLVTYADYDANGEGPLSQAAGNINLSYTSSYLERHNGAAPLNFPCTEGMSNSGNAFTYPYFDLYYGPYMSCTVYPNAGSSINITGFSLGIRSSLYGAYYTRLVYSIDGGNSWIDDGADTYIPYSSCITQSDVYAFTLTWPLSGSQIATSNNGVEFRIYGYGAAQASGNFQLHTVQIYGTVQDCSSLTIDQSDFSICDGGSASLSASGASNYLWTPSDGLSSDNVSNPIASPSSNTVYTLNGCPDATVTVNVSAQPTGPTLASQTPSAASICAGGQVSATFSSGTGGSGCGDDFTFSIDGGSATPYTPGDLVGSTATNSIVIQGRRATCTDGAGCTGTDYTTLASWTINSPPTFTATGTNITCNGDTNGTINVSISSGVAPFSYSINNGGSFNYNSDTITGLLANTYTVQVIDSNGCKASDSAIVIISQPAILTPPFITLTKNITCDSSTAGVVSITTLPTGGTSPYQFSINAGNYQGDTTFIGLSAGTYSVIALDSNGCISPVSDSITLATSQPYITAASNGPVCEGDTLKLFASNFSNATYSWTGPNTFSEKNPVKANASLSDDGTYSVIATVGSCTSSPATTVVLINPSPSASISSNGDTLTSYNATSFQWYLGDSLISGATSSTYVAQQSGSYSVLITDSNGCTAFSNGVNVTVLGIATLTGNNIFEIYPNPVGDKFTVITNNSDVQRAPIELIDVSGRKYAHGNMPLGTQFSKTEIDVSMLAPGVYILKINNTLRRFVKQ